MELNLEGSASSQSVGPSKYSSANVSNKLGTGAWGIPSCSSSDASLFSSSLPVLPHEKLNINESEHSGRSLVYSSSKLDNLENDDKDPFEDIDPNVIGNMLPGNEEELLAGLMDDLDLSGLPSQLEDLEDVFGSGGGLELEFEPNETLRVGMSILNRSDGVAVNGFAHYPLPNNVGTVAGEHPYGEHPSRTLFVRNINSNVEDSELRSVFEQYGDIRTLYTACKHRGFVMISYYDIRDARAAMRALQNKPLRRRKLDIHFSIPKDNPSEKDINQGTLVAFNLDASVSNDDLLRIFGAYGEVKEIRETPHKRHHKFIEYYDVRAAEAALKGLNRCDIAGKRIKLEPSRPGGARRNLMQQLTQELELNETRGFRHQVGSPVANSPPSTWALFGCPVERSMLGFTKSPGLKAFSPVNGNNLPGLASILPPLMSNPPKIAPIGKDQGRASYINQIHANSCSTQGSFMLSHSFPDQKSSTSPSPLSVFGVSNSNSSATGTLSGPQFLWGSPTLFSEPPSSSVWPPVSMHASVSSAQQNGFPHSSQHGTVAGSHHHVGSAPSHVPLKRHLGFFSDLPEASVMIPVPHGGIGSNCNSGRYMMNMGACATIGSGTGQSRSMTENNSPSLQMMSFQRHNQMFLGNGPLPGPGTISNEQFAEHGRIRQVENNVSQKDSEKQYELDLDKIISGEDTRTTLMIKNIPNKYTSKMLLLAIDENHHGSYDFLYLPIDFKNKCNVGYAFINMISPSHVVPFYKAFDRRKWEKFNSEKVASLAYAQIQGKAALVAHFQNSSLMNEDKMCRPIIFQPESQEADNQMLQEHILSGNLNIFIHDGSYSGDLLDSLKGGLDEILDSK